MPDYKRLPKAALPATLILLLLLLLLQAPCTANIDVCPDGCEYTDISNALNASDPGETITVSGGLYQDPFLISERITLRGQDDGDGAPVLSPESGRVILGASGAVLRGFQIAALPGAGGGSGGQNESCSLEVILPATVFLNDISGRSAVCSEEAASWNSTEEITYQYNSRVQRSRIGNYWADYNGTDEDGDGIGDQPALLNDNNIDYHPLISSVDSYKTSDEKEPKAGLIQANVGEPFTITLPSNPSTGYTWTFDYDYVLLKAEQAEFEQTPARSIRIGSGGSSVFIFTPIAPGKTTIRFVYKRPWENIVAETRTYYVDILGQEERMV